MCPYIPVTRSPVYALLCVLLAVSCFMLSRASLRKDSLGYALCAHGSHCRHPAISRSAPADCVNGGEVPHTTMAFSSFKGEIVVNEVSFVRKCIATDTSQYDLWGKLICSNFKISFITDDPMPLQVGPVCAVCAEASDARAAVTSAQVTGKELT